jgi:hypothetical protein
MDSGNWRRSRRLGAAVGAMILLLAIALPSFANLPGSTFEGNDGNLVVNTAGNTDWVNAPNRVRGDDLPSGSTDNSFGQGTKEDDANVTVVTGSIPPQKSNLTRFYVASEFASNSNFLYLAWERSNVLGSANMDFELNQKAQPNLTTTGPKTLIRTAGDILVTFDFGGSGSPVLGLLKWVTTGATSQCFSSNSLPCWGNRVNLSAAGFAEGAVNSVTVTDSIAGVSLPAGTFGEAAINLTAAGVFPAGTCEALGSAFLKSRSSASFPAEVKDFVAPQPVNISNCGTVNIHKQDDAGAPLAGAVFTLYKDNAPIGGTRGAEDTITTLTCTTLATGNCSILNVPFGDYWAVETTGVPNHDLAPDQHVTVSQQTQTINLTFVDPRQPGAILITKTAKNADLGTGQHPLAGATFDVTDSSDVSVGGGTSNADGEVCVDGLTIGGTYTVTETDAPAGYSIDTTSKDVTITGTATCGSGDENTVTFTDTPLTDLDVTATSEVPGATHSQITCTDASDADIGDSPSGNVDPASVTANGLEPGTYTCVVVIDP